jgi:hypothetical protein
MKHSKKVVNVPEAEYKALMGLLSGNTDPLSMEKYQTDVKIQENFRKPALTPLERNVKYQSLNRKRKKLAKMITNKPLKVIVENSKIETPAPTEGIAPAQKPQNNIQEAQHNIEPPQNIEVEQQVAPEQPPQVKGVLDDFKGIIKEEYYFLHIYVCIFYIFILQKKMSSSDEDWPEVTIGQIWAARYCVNDFERVVDRARYRIDDPETLENVNAIRQHLRPHRRFGRIPPPSGPYRMIGHSICMFFPLQCFFPQL